MHDHQWVLQVLFNHLILLPLHNFVAPLLEHTSLLFPTQIQLRLLLDSVFALSSTQEVLTEENSVVVLLHFLALLLVDVAAGLGGGGGSR